jgi:hypothetical protein
MKNVCLFLAVLCCTSLFSQEKGDVSGTILDAELQNEPMLFANISLEGSSLQTRTNIFGDFEINGVAPGDHILRITFAGYETQELPITVLAGDRTVVNTAIHAKTLHLEEVVLPNLSTAVQDKALTKNVQSLPND